MAILKKRQFGKTLITGIVVVAVLAVFVPLVSAYEAHTVNVKVSIEERFNVVKYIRLADAQDIFDAREAGITFPCDPDDPNPDPVDLDDPYNVPTNTCVLWVVTIGFMNPHSYNMTEVVVKDNFGAELAGEPLDEVPVDLDFKYHTRGKPNKKKDPFTTQYRIIWYVTYVSGNWTNPEDPENPLDNSDVLEPEASEYIEVLVWTKLNPAGKQEYTSWGPYTLNSGPTGKWFDAPPDEGGHQFSFDGEPVHIYAYPYPP